jgi:hypothetical protein
MPVAGGGFNQCYNAQAVVATEPSGDCHGRGSGAQRQAAGRAVVPRRRSLAEASLIDWRRPYREALVNEWLPTRLGDGTVSVAVRNLASPFTGDDINALPVPSRWLRGATPPVGPIEVHDGRMMIGAAECTYNRLGLLKRQAIGARLEGANRSAWGPTVRCQRHAQPR